MFTYISPYFIGVFIVENVSFSVRLFESNSLLGRTVTIGQVLVFSQNIPTKSQFNCTRTWYQATVLFAPLNQSEANILRSSGKLNVERISNLFKCVL